MTNKRKWSKDSDAERHAAYPRRRGRTLHFDQRLLRRSLELLPTDRILELGYDDLETPLQLASGTVAPEVPMPQKVVSLRPTVDLVELLRQLKVSVSSGSCKLDVWLADTIPESESGLFDVVLLLAPYYLGNERVRADIATAYRALRPGGILYLQAHRRQGAETFARYTAERFRELDLVAIRGGNRLYQAVRGPARVTSRVGTDELDTTVLKETVCGFEVELETQAGVFSRRRFDLGSRLLAETMQIGPSDKVVDLGCGAGLLGIVAALISPRAEVVLLDNRLQTLKLAERNLHRNGILNATVRLSDGLNGVAGRMFDVIVTNPPLHEGGVYKATPAERFVAASSAHLGPRGQLFVLGPRTLVLPRLAAPYFHECVEAAADRVNVVWSCSQPKVVGAKSSE